MRRLCAMSYEECREALRSHAVGRAAVQTVEGPYLLPVAYVAVDDALYFRVDPGSVLARNVLAGTVAFEVDDFGGEDVGGWSVVARGQVSAVDHDSELYELVWTQLTGQRTAVEESVWAATPAWWERWGPHSRAG